MRILVAIASHGLHHAEYLARTLQAYQSMAYQADLVLHSDRPRSMPEGVTVVVGLPTADPYSLPFAHKRLFAERKGDYDLFLYAEDDILIQQDNLAAFLEVTQVLPDDEVAGFFRYEKDEAGRVFYVDAHDPFGWVPGSVRTLGGYTFASFSNDHSGCYLLTRYQLERALRSGGYLVAPHASWYGPRESAATDPYRQCGLTKRLCISHLSRFLVHHLPNNYVDVLGTAAETLHQQINALLRPPRGAGRPHAWRPVPAPPRKGRSHLLDS